MPQKYFRKKKSIYWKESAKETCHQYYYAHTHIAHLNWSTLQMSASPQEFSS